MKRRGRNLVEATEPEVLDLVVRGGRVVTPDGVQAAELGILHGKIVRLAPEVTDRRTRNSTRPAAMFSRASSTPTCISTSPAGRSGRDWPMARSRSRPAGGTCFFDMPLNSEPPVLDAAALRVKRELAEQQSCVDFAVVGGLVPGNLDKLAGLRDAGAIA